MAVAVAGRETVVAGPCSVGGDMPIDQYKRNRRKDSGTVHVQDEPEAGIEEQRDSGGYRESCCHSSSAPAAHHIPDGRNIADLEQSDCSHQHEDSRQRALSGYEEQICDPKVHHVKQPADDQSQEEATLVFIRR